MYQSGKQLAAINLARNLTEWTIVALYYKLLLVAFGGKLSDVCADAQALSCPGTGSGHPQLSCQVRAPDN